MSIDNAKDRTEYKIGRLIYIQKELTWADDKKLVKLYNSVSGIAFRNEEIKLSDLQPLLSKYNLLDAFFGIILSPKITALYLISFKWIDYLFRKKISINKATNTQIGQIFSDFFLLNRKFVNKLNDLLKSLDLIASTHEKTEKKKIVKLSENLSTLKSQEKVSSTG